MRKIILATTIFFLLVGTCLAVTVGEFTGFDWGVVVGGRVEIPSTISSHTYWHTAYGTTGDWDTAYGTDWDKTYTTETP